MDCQINVLINGELRNNSSSNIFPGSNLVMGHQKSYNRKNDNVIWRILNNGYELYDSI
jgi:hypothetical protein